MPAERVCLIRPEIKYSRKGTFHFYLCIRPKLFSKMETGQLCSLQPTTLSSVAHLRPISCREKGSSNISPYSSLPLGWSPIQCQSNGIFPCFFENPLCHFLHAGFPDALAVQCSPHQIQSHLWALLILDFTEILQSIQQSPYTGLKWNKINSSVSYILYPSIRFDLNQSTPGKVVTGNNAVNILITTDAFQRSFWQSTTCQWDLMLSAPEELLFKETTVTPFVKGIITS